MSLQVVYTPRSKESSISVYNFIRNKFSIRSADKFLLKAEKIIELIADYPLMYKATSIDEKVRIAVITKQTSLFYKVTDTSIQLLFFWDNRQEPILPS